MDYNTMSDSDRFALVWSSLYSSVWTQLYVINELNNRSTVEVIEYKEESLSHEVKEPNGAEELISTIVFIEEEVQGISGISSIPFECYVHTDTINIKALLSEEQEQLLERKLIKKYRYIKDNKNYKYVFNDPRVGVFLYYKPREPYKRKLYTLSLFNQGYSHESQLLNDVMSVIPESQIKYKEIHTAVDIPYSIKQTFLVPPNSRINMIPNQNTLYYGAKNANHRMVVYDKQLQLRETRGIEISTCTRFEYRQVLPRMKPVDEVLIDDMEESKHYFIAYNVDQYDDKYREMMNQFIINPLSWKEEKRRKKEAFREYVADRSVSMYDLINHGLKGTKYSSLVHTSYNIEELFRVS